MIVGLMMELSRAVCRDPNVHIATRVHALQVGIVLAQQVVDEYDTTGHYDTTVADWAIRALNAEPAPFDADQQLLDVDISLDLGGEG